MIFPWRRARALSALSTLAAFLAIAVILAGPCRAGEPDAWGGRAQWGDLGNGRYRNPILPADYSDLDAIRVGDDYYAISSTFQFSPGMAILHSRDLVNWKTVGHAVPDLTQISPELNWDRMNRYGRGIWAGAIRHHAGRYWIYFGTPEEGYFMTSADRPEGPWAPLHRMLPAAGWDDCAPFWDDDGKGYFIGTNFKDGYKIHLWEMSADNKTLIPESDQVIYQSKGSEANKLYKFNGTYYHFFSEVHGDTRVMMMRRAGSIQGPWSDKRQLMHGDLASRQPNQGGIVQGPDKNWYFFTHHGDGAWEGRAASLLPVHWIDGWPVIGQPDAAGLGTMVWEGSMPATGLPRQFPQGGDNFDAGTLAPVWEWNYQPRMDKWSMSARPGFMRLHGFAGLDGGNLLKVGNVLTQRVVRGASQAFAARLELKGMADGQHAGLAHFTAQPRARNAAESTASAGVVMADGRGYLEVSRDGVYTRLQSWPHDAIWLRSGWGMDGKATLSVSADGQQFQPVQTDFPLTWGAYRGSRVGLFTFNPAAEQGYVDIDSVNYDIGAHAAGAAPKPLYRDPVSDGAADASIVYDRAAKLWKMFYTNRRATMKLPDPDDVEWVHGTAIGIATSQDGVQWQYQGTAGFPKECTDATLWAPDILYENGMYHMWLTIVPGIFHRWGVPGADGRIEHLTSTDLSTWKCEGTVKLDTGRMIDPTVVKLGQGYRMWYKDERAGSRILAADSRDLRSWTKVSGHPVNPTKGEGAKVFRFKGHYWLIADVWKGLMVLRSDDALSWTEQPGYILGQPGRKPTDRHKGQHADVVVNGERAFIYYFVHQENETEAAMDPRWNQRTVIQVAELVYRDGKLLVDRDADLSFRLHAPSP